MALRLPEADRATFIVEFHTHLHEAYGIVQKEYVTVSAPLLAETAKLAPWFEASHRYALGLRPKPSKR